MKLDREVIEELLVPPGGPADLDHRSTRSTAYDWVGSTGRERRAVAEADLRSYVGDITAAQQRFWAAGTHALLVILQAMDAAGKDGTIRHVMSGVNPHGCRVESFERPSERELGHDFLWRYSRALPELGMIGIFNRSYYEDVTIVRVHPELLARGRSRPAELTPHNHVWHGRFEDINAFEHHLHRNGTRIVKIFLNVSKDTQKKRLLERIDDPAKNWKFSADDLAERARWDDYRIAYEEALSATSTEWAPWYVVPADRKYELRALVGGLVVHAMDELDLRTPAPTPELLAALDRARRDLLAE